ncbi:SMI1/KNR4 family protein [Bacillus sp. FJAT-53711]|uniref:SMI1/KNR4 family protein n=1 Tax=Bacillus yunxiaonensis TaxID=3127665 RepID=A0ABU8FS72_9BACI
MVIEKLLDKVNEFQGPIENFKLTGLTLIYVSQELKNNKDIVFPDNVVYAFFKGVNDDFISEIERKNNMKLPLVYKNLVKICNGFSLGLGYGVFYGLPTRLWKGVSWKEKPFLADDVIEENKNAPKKITKRFFVIGRNFSTGDWLGIKDNKMYLINKFGKQLQEIDFYNVFIQIIEDCNNQPEKLGEYIKELYKNV